MVHCETLSQLTDKRILQGQKLALEEYPMRLVEGKLLSIKTKDARLIKFNLNNPQKSFLEIIKERLKSGKPVRIWLLKARQSGMSTLTEAILYAYTSQKENVNSLIMADEKEHAKNLFEMSKLYQEKLEEKRPHLVPKLEKSNEIKLSWEGIHSQIIIATADNTTAARSHTYQFVHLSEVAWFRDFDEVMTGLMQSVPSLPETLVIGETTANGMNFFYDEWTKAVDGGTDWIPVFIPWFALPEYSMPLQDDEFYPIRKIAFSSDMSESKFLIKEKQLQNEFDLTDEQMNWRRWCIVNNCNGDLDRFAQEYPSTWQEAFKMSGSLFFDRRGLARQVKERPIMKGEIFHEAMKYEFRELPEGRIKIYEKPVSNEQYIVVTDASEALDQDEASALVLNKRTNATVATVNGQYPPEDLAHIGVMLANYYNEAELVPENKGYGYMVCQHANKVYGNIYKRKRTKSGSTEEMDELGFNTNSVTRPEMLARFGEEVRVCSTILRDPELISQCYSFIIKKDKDGNVKKVEAANGKQDGLVICRAIAGQVRFEKPYKPKASNIVSQRVAHQRKVRDLQRMNSFGG